MDPADEDARIRELCWGFYTTSRAGAVRLSDGGGPFGFDVQKAQQVDYLMRTYGLDGIIETGCHMGDTTAYLAAIYPELPIVTCDINPEYFAFTKARLRSAGNVTVLHGNSSDLLPNLVSQFRKPLVYLDAHWGPEWPLLEELACVRHGLVAVDDFNINHPRFGYDTYDGVDCGPELVRQALPDLDRLFVGNPYGHYGLPCLQVGRRSGVGYIPLGLDLASREGSDMFAPVALRPGVGVPPWAAGVAA